ncbi:hypothetical protein GWG54_15215 [Natronococcus sp. JC468]|uniref:hypothetical protein n=1 Tax=Natronococcus sp. JC468 TaxID=1961921 RepID=UPI00143B86D6|nr:hypothetical protein [Natronococcus sp. JC468]NKE37147.1 hypothetical protein [Natronococcus sp. JC468]
MSVFRRSGVFGRTTRRRVFDAAAAVSAGAVEAVSVGLWFALAAGSRTTATALVGAAVLVCGTLVRTRIVAAAVDGWRVGRGPRRVGLALAVAAGWICWLLAAENVGSSAGAIVSTALLGAGLSVQFALEDAGCRPRSADADRLASIVPGFLLALGAGGLLRASWASGWAIVSPPLPLGATTAVVRIEPLQLGLLGFAAVAVAAHHRRLRRLLAS